MLSHFMELRMQKNWSSRSVEKGAVPIKFRLLFEVSMVYTLELKVNQQWNSTHEIKP